ncbi:MAG: ATP-dependent Clp protease adapter ClpS [Epsilonproteobacteria bacterium]|nr:MAG: ATP-dependent Clp protease adapter ClpS [Campylobacterota bacterium]RLA66912.1 MAG: ATP-dependent Clp protease adapter ClpS [Campylobacterota bacterium]
MKDQKVDKFFLNPIFSTEDGGEDYQYEEEVITQERVKRPKMYKVLLHNDDYTTMEFVTHVLEKYFFKTPEQAQDIMLTVHSEGQGVCGIYTFEVAETKAAQVTRLARENGHPLKCSFEEE